MLNLTVRKDTPLQFAALLLAGQEFNTHGNLRARRGFCGLGAYVPFDDVEVDELHRAQYVVYSYDTPIAWRTNRGAWVLNQTRYGATTSKHQGKIFSAIDQL
jgi:hypothetical protein